MPVAAGDRAEVAPVRGEDVEATVTLGEHDARGVGQVEGRQVGVSGEQGARPRQVLFPYPIHLVGGLYFLDGDQFRSASVAGQNEVVQLGQDQRGDDQRGRAC